MGCNSIPGYENVSCQLVSYTYTDANGNLDLFGYLLVTDVYTYGNGVVSEPYSYQAYICTEALSNIPSLPPVNPTCSANLPANSTINIDTVALNESVSLVGIAFTLSYASDRFRQGFSFSPLALGIGGLTRSVHHYDFVNNVVSGDRKYPPGDRIGHFWREFCLTNHSATEIYYFDGNGNHQKTVDALTGVTTQTMTYDGSGRILGIQDQFGNLTAFQYSGSQILITSPYGQISTLALDQNGYLASVTNPNNETYHVTNSSSGLLQSFFQKPLGQASQVTYDSNGFLIKDQGAGGDFISLLRQYDATRKTQTITASTAMNRQAIYQTQAFLDGANHDQTDSTGETVDASDSLQGPFSVSDSIGINQNASIAKDLALDGWLPINCKPPRRWPTPISTRS